MNLMRRVTGHVLALGCATTLILSAAHADITIEQKISVEGAGAMSMANMSGTSTMAISGNRSRTESDMQMQSKLVRMFARDAGQTSEIVRLDDGKIYDLNIKKKQYTETTVEDKRAQFAQAMEQAKQAQAKQPSPTGMDEEQCEWSDPKVEVKKTGAKASIAGFNAEQTTVVATQSCKDRKSGAVCDVALSLDQWLSTEFDGGAEAMQFHQAYAQKMGITKGGSNDVTERAEAMFGRYKGIWSEVANKMRGVKGYPVKSSFSLGFGGPQCQSAQQAQQAQASLPPAPTTGAMGEAAATAAGQAAGEAAAAKAGQSALGGYAGQIGGKIAGTLFKRKKQEAQPEATAEQAAAAPAPVVNNMITPLRVTSELVSVKKEAIPASTFDVPAGFKKVAKSE